MKVKVRRTKPTWHEVQGRELEAYDDIPFESTQRMAVPGGWLYRTLLYTAGYGTAVSLVFVPTPKASGR